MFPRTADPDSYRPHRRRRSGSATSIYGGRIQSRDLATQLHGRRWYGTATKTGIAQEMMSDPHVRQSLAYLADPLRAAIWDVEPASDSELDREIAAFCRWALFENHRFDDVLRRILLFLRDGFSICEVTDDVREIPDRFPLHRGRGFGIVPTGFHFLPAWSVYEWRQSSANPNQLSAVIQEVAGSDVEPFRFQRISARHLLRWTHDQEGGDFEGVAPLRSAYTPWYFKRTFMIVDAIRHERQNTGIPTINFSEEPSEQEEEDARDILEAITANEKGHLVLGPGMSFAWNTSSIQDGTAIHEAIERCNRDIVINVGAGFMLLGLASKSGSYALANTQQGQYQIQLDGYARQVCDVFNHGSDGWSPIERLVSLNYGPGVRLPRLVARNMPTRDWSKTAPLLYNLANARFITPDAPTEAYLREALQIPPHDPASARSTDEPVEIMPIEEPEET